MNEPNKAVEVLDRDEAPSPADLERVGLTPSPSYMQAIEIGHVVAASHLVPSARTAARAAFVIMLGLDMGLSPSAAVTGIHVIEDKDGQVNFVIEGRLLGALVNERPGIAYKVEKSTEEEAELSFWRDGEEVGPRIKWDKARAVRAGLWGKGAWSKHPDEMLRWRALGEGVRIYFPEVISGSRVYVEGEIDAPGAVRQALEGPQPAPPVTGEEAEQLRAEASEVFEQIRALNPDRLLRTRFNQRLAQTGHSLVELRNGVKALHELLEQEQTYQRVLDSIRTLFGDDAASDAAKVAERRSSPQERIASVDDALLRLVAEKEEGETDD